MKHFKRSVCMIARSIVLIAVILGLTACVGIAADSLDSFVGTRFTSSDPRRPDLNPQVRNAYYRGHGGIYKEEPEGKGRRVYINYFRHCRYSLLIDENDIIQSWRDEGGPVHMRDCKFS